MIKLITWCLKTIPVFLMLTFGVVFVHYLNTQGRLTTIEEILFNTFVVLFYAPFYITILFKWIGEDDDFDN